MPDERLTDRLRALAQRTRSPEHSTSTTETAEALEAAADELERLEREAHPLRSPAEPREVYIGETMGDFAAPAGHVFAAIVLPHAEALQLCGGDRPGGLAGELDAIARELAGDAGVAAPMPQPRRFVAYYRDGWALPAPGSFVQAGPVGSTWRVLAVEPPGAGDVRDDTYAEPDGSVRWPVLLELEAVDPHDVPMAARVEVVPAPVDDAGASS